MRPTRRRRLRFTPETLGPRLARCDEHRAIKRSRAHGNPDGRRHQTQTDFTLGNRLRCKQASRTLIRLATMRVRCVFTEDVHVRHFTALPHRRDEIWGNVACGALAGIGMVSRCPALSGHMWWLGRTPPNRARARAGDPRTWGESGDFVAGRAPFPPEPVS